MEPKKSKLRIFQEGAEAAVNNPTMNPKFQQLRDMIGGSQQPSEPKPSSFDLTQDDMDRAKAVQQRQLQPQQAPQQQQVPGNIKDMMEQQQYLESLQDFDRAGPDEIQKLQRIKEMLRQK